MPQAEVLTECTILKASQILDCQFRSVSSIVGEVSPFASLTSLVYGSRQQLPGYSHDQAVPVTACEGRFLRTPPHSRRWSPRRIPFRLERTPLALLMTSPSAAGDCLTSCCRAAVSTGLGLQTKVVVSHGTVLCSWHVRTTSKELHLSAGHLRKQSSSLSRGMLSSVLVLSRYHPNRYGQRHHLKLPWLSLVIVLAWVQF